MSGEFINRLPESYVDCNVRDAGAIPMVYPARYYYVSPLHEAGSKQMYVFETELNLPIINGPVHNTIIQNVILKKAGCSTCLLKTFCRPKVAGINDRFVIIPGFVDGLDHMHAKTSIS